MGRFRRALATAALTAAVAAVPAAGAPEAAPKRGGTVVVAWAAPAEPGCVLQCPQPLIGTQEYGLVVARALELDPGGWRPGLARATVTRNPFAVTFHIRPGARWSDGRPLTAADLVYAYRAYLRHSGSPPDDPLRTQIRRFAALDARTARVTFRERYGEWRSLIGTFAPMPRHVLGSEAPHRSWTDAIVNPRTGRPIGSGPFLLGRWERGRQLVLVRNPRYWRGRTANLDRLVFRFGLSDPAEALRRGEVDVVGGSAGAAAQNAAYQFVERPARGVEVRSAPGSQWEHLDLRLGPGGHPALRDRRVRQALAHGIDRAALVRALFAREAAGIGVLDSTTLLTNERGYRRNWSRYRHRPALARRLLEQAGCRRGGDGIYVCGGERLSLRFVTFAGVPRRQRTLQLLQSQLRAVGVEVVPSYHAAFGLVLARGDFDVALFAWDRNPEIPETPYTCENRFNFTGYCSRLVNADAAQLRRIVAPSRRIAVANSLDRRLAQDVPVVPLYQVPNFVAFRSSVRGIRPNAFANVTWNAEEWWRAR